MLDENDDIEFLSQPLTNEDGSINEACLNELYAALRNIDPPHIRLAKDMEWSVKEDMWVFKMDIVGAFAMFVCSQSKCVPAGFENVCSYLSTCLGSDFDWGDHEMLEMSLCDINKALYDILDNQGVGLFDAWGLDSTSLFHSVCLQFRDERRFIDKFQKEFEEEFGPLEDE